LLDIIVDLSEIESGLDQPINRHQYHLYKRHSRQSEVPCQKISKF
jgi:hypothetical protein